MNAQQDGKEGELTADPHCIHEPLHVCLFTTFQTRHSANLAPNNRHLTTVKCLPSD